MSRRLFEAQAHERTFYGVTPDAVIMAARCYGDDRGLKTPGLRIRPSKGVN